MVPLLWPELTSWPFPTLEPAVSVAAHYDSWSLDTRKYCAYLSADRRFSAVQFVWTASVSFWLVVPRLVYSQLHYKISCYYIGMGSWIIAIPCSRMKSWKWLLSPSFVKWNRVTATQRTIKNTREPERKRTKRCLWYLRRFKAFRAGMDITELSVILRGFPRIASREHYHDLEGFPSHIHFSHLRPCPLSWRLKQTTTSGLSVPIISHVTFVVCFGSVRASLCL